MGSYGIEVLPEHGNRHLLRYWQRCRNLFAEGDLPLSTFCAITLIEEVGKVPMLAFRDQERTEMPKPFRKHAKKYQSAVGTTLVVNARVSRIYGKREEEFARWFRDGELMRIRNNSLYMNLAGGSLLTPEQMITNETAFLLVCFAGEVLAEAQGALTGTGPDEWERILAEVDEFRGRFGAPS